MASAPATSAGPQASRHYPTTMGEFLAWFSTDEDCRDYLRWLRWPDGFSCPGVVEETGELCGGAGWELADGRYQCAACGLRTSVTAGTVFDGTRLPLTVWFHAALSAYTLICRSAYGLMCRSPSTH